MNAVPEVRVSARNECPINPDGDLILYWMTASRRLSNNFALDRTFEWARRLNRPVLILEALRCDYPWASRRLHWFVVQGMRDNRDQASRAGVAYHCYLERSHGEGSGLIEYLSSRSCVIVTDDFPCFFLPRMIQAVSRRVPVRLEAVDSNGLLPMRASSEVFPTAYAFRRFLQKELPKHLSNFPSSCPPDDSAIPRLSSLPELLNSRWREPDVALLRGDEAAWAQLPVDHTVGPGLMSGGANAGNQCLKDFLARRFPRYAEQRNHPDEDAASGLSPWLHFGHLSTHEVFRAIAESEHWTLASLRDHRQTRGSRSGWWGMSEAAESFLDELITWRELGFNMCCHRKDYDRYESLPEWAIRTLADHAADPRPVIYSDEELDASQTHDELWNAAQNQLRREGRMHNYLRMLWGKKILEWSESPQAALRTMIELNNRYALDGRNPNSYSGIFWVMGRYDRAWGPERPIFGKIRYMSSDNTARKLRLSNYLSRYGN